MYSSLSVSALEDINCEILNEKKLPVLVSYLDPDQTFLRIGLRTFPRVWIRILIGFKNVEVPVLLGQT
jgi:hypothetical protein